MDNSLQNNQLLKALCREPTEFVPVWVMRQAGRYLPEYLKIRYQTGDFLSLCKNPDLACEVALQPLKRFNLDAAILFSDILTIPDAMGLGLYFESGEGPKFRKTIRTEMDIAKLNPIDVDTDLEYVTKAVRNISSALNGRIPLIGFSGSPWTLATYMVEGSSSKDFRHIKAMRYQTPELLHQLLSLLADAVLDYVLAQARAGAQVIQLFDTWGGILSKSCFLEFSLKYMSRIVAGVRSFYSAIELPIILFTKNASQFLPEMANSGANALGIDWTVDFKTAIQLVGDRVALQGNMDPCVLYADKTVIQKEVKRIIEQNSHRAGFIFNLGHGIPPQVSPESVEIMVDAVHEFSSI